MLQNKISIVELLGANEQEFNKKIVELCEKFNSHLNDCNILKDKLVEFETEFNNRIKAIQVIIDHYNEILLTLESFKTKEETKDIKTKSFLDRILPVIYILAGAIIGFIIELIKKG